MNYQANRKTCLTISYEELAVMIPCEVADLEHLVESGALRHAQVKDPETGEFVTKIAFYSSTVSFVRGLLTIKNTANTKADYSGAYRDLFQLDPSIPLGSNWVSVGEYTRDNKERQKLYQASYGKKIPYFKQGTNHIIAREDAQRILGKKSMFARVKSFFGECGVGGRACV